MRSLLIAACALSLVACNAVSQQTSGNAEKSLVVLYDNDVHCAIDGYARIAGLRDAILAADTAYVAVVSAGDYVQGGPSGTLSQGQSIIDVMNAVGYDAVTLGNHEFDYGAQRLFELTSQLHAPITCVNFSDLSSGKQFHAPYVLRQYGGRKVAFVGVLTPGTLQSEAAAFYDAEGHQLYSLHPDEVYSLVGQAAQKAREAGADYVVVLSHLGETGYSVTSGQLIAYTKGIDAVLDGHTHSVLPEEWVINVEGNDVLSTQTGTKFAHIGKLLITPQGKITSELLSLDSIPYINERVQAVIDSVHAVDAKVTARVCGKNDQLLSINDASGVRQCRRAEVALGNLIADAFRWFGGSQLAFCNGGGLRADLPAGDLTYGHLLTVQPFSNELAVFRVTGSQLCNILELASERVPDEAGHFAHPSGFRYTIDTNALPRVSHVEVLNDKGKYEPIRMDAEYTLTTLVYLTTQYNQILQNCEVVKSNIGLDVEATYNFLSTPLHGRIGSEYAQPQGRIIIR